MFLWITKPSVLFSPLHSLSVSLEMLMDCVKNKDLKKVSTDILISVCIFVYLSIANLRKLHGNMYTIYS